MKTSQVLAASALLAGYVQACTRIRVDNVRVLSQSLLTHFVMFRQKSFAP
jgi:predicted hydrolase (HD superfamily)